MGMLHRRTAIVHTILAGHMSRVDAARRNEAGVQVMTMGQLAARLAGGLLQPVDLDVLTETVRDALPDVEMGELEPIKDLPGMPAAVTATFDKAWRAGIDLSEVGHLDGAVEHAACAVLAGSHVAPRREPGPLLRLPEFVKVLRIGVRNAAVGRASWTDAVVAWTVVAMARWRSLKRLPRSAPDAGALLDSDFMPVLCVTRRD